MREMRETGVEWVGAIPKHWAITKLKYLGEYINGYAFKPDDWGEHGKPIIRIQDLTKSTQNTNYYDGTIPEKYLVQNGDILVSWAATLDAFTWTKGEGWLNQHIFKAVPNNTLIDKDYFYWLIKLAMQHMNNDNKHGIVMQHVTLNVFNNFSVPLPDIHEQRKIASVLQGKCAQVDSLIANVQSQIEKLKGYKGGVVTDVVTKGLNPTVQMKDSGIAWLGEIPENWEVIRGKALFRESDSRSIDGSEELLTVSQYTGITPRSHKNVNMFEALTLEGYKVCEIGDIAANTMWLWAGAIGVSEYHGVISPSYNVYKQKADAFDPKYLDLLLRAPMLVQEYASLSTGIRASRLRLYPKDFLNIRFPVPPRKEQEEMVRVLSKKIADIDRLIAIKEAKIEKLEQYKKILIFEYVTGKKEVS